MIEGTQFVYKRLNGDIKGITKIMIKIFNKR